MKIAANIIGIAAVTLYILCYQLKTRKGILFCNIISRALYILQYLLLFAFEGMALDIVGIVASVLAQKKDTPFIKKHIKLFFIGMNLVIIITGLLLYKNIFSLFPVLGVLFHTGAFWLDDEKWIRRVSLIGSPFWMVYNFVSGAYGSTLGDSITIVSLIVAMFRYDFKKKEITE